ncbi:iron ABC transporter permease [Microbacterium istanbulense]|uniref:Iron ABC transporter permease n=1 Tax=Microbacterium istanbulense TaxID=3122049 RepID=A0ABU8LHX9_9MICO
MVLVCLLCAGALIPVGYVVASGVAIGVDELRALLWRPRAGELLSNTVLLVVLGVPLTMAIGTGCAWLVERVQLPFRRTLAVLCAAPLAIPAFVSSYAWGSVAPGVSGLAGALLVSVLAYSPLVFLPILAALRGLDKAWEEAARSLGLGPWRVFFRVVLPQLRLAMLGGGLVVGLHLLAEYGAFAFIRFDTFTTAIVVAYQSTFAGPAAASLGIVLTSLCALLLLGDTLLQGHGRYARVGSGAPRRAEPLRLRPLPTAAMLLLPVGYVIAAAGVPMTIVIRWLFHGTAIDVETLVSTVLTTLALGTAGALATVVVALPIAWLSARYPGRLSRTLAGAAYLASSLPAIIVALALVTVTVRVAPAIYQSAGLVVAAYAIIFLPRAIVTLRAGIAQTPVGLEEAARALGVSPLVARLRVTLPLLLPTLAAATSLVALGAAGELTATLLLAPTGTRTVATQFWAAASSIDYAAAAPYALLLVALSAPAVAIMFTHATRGRSR